VADAVKDGSARAGAWPGFVNIPSKIGQVALSAPSPDSARAGRHARHPARRGLPGHDEHAYLGHVVGRQRRPQPRRSRSRLLDLAFDAVNADHYGQLVRNGNVLPWAPGGRNTASGGRRLARIVPGLAAAHGGYPGGLRGTLQGWFRR